MPEEKRTDEQVRAAQKAEFDSYIAEVKAGGEVVGPVTLRASYEDPAVNAVLGGIEVRETGYDEAYQERSYELVVDGKSRARLRVKEWVKGVGEIGTDSYKLVRTNSTDSDGKGYFWTQAFAAEGYLGVTLTEDGHVRSIGMPEGHTTPLVVELVKKVAEEK